MAMNTVNGGGSRTRGARYRPMSEINVTPFVDVMLVLLVVFMITAPLMTVGVPVNLPKTKAAVISNPDEPIVISIDASDTEDVIQLVDAFRWEHGDKRVIQREVNLGLRRHAIACGNLTEEYGTVIVLEDDLYVSRNFYKYALHAATAGCYLARLKPVLHRKIGSVGLDDISASQKTLVEASVLMSELFVQINQQG